MTQTTLKGTSAQQVQQFKRLDAIILCGARPDSQAGNCELGTHADAGQVDTPQVRMNPSLAVELHNGIFF